MCDYSLHNVASRPARVGDKLVTTGFRGTITRGFAADGEPEVAVCLLPGTELAFEQEAERERVMFARRKLGARVARFRQVKIEDPTAHHDALEFSNGTCVLVTKLLPRQRATVLQLPAARPGELRAPERQGDLESVR